MPMHVSSSDGFGCRRFPRRHREIRKARKSMSLAPKHEHETFEIPEERRAVIRSDRRAIIGVRSELEFPSGSFEVSNYSATGIAIVVPMGADQFTKTEVYTASHLVDGIKVGSYQLCLARKVQLGAGEGIQVAFELKSGSVPIDKIHTAIKFRKVLHGFSETQREMEKIPQDFRRLTLEAKLFLQNLEVQVEELRAERKYCSLQELQNFEETLIPIAADFIAQFFKPGYAQLEQSLQNVPEANLPSCIAFFREQLKELIYQSSFAHRSVAKPLGYAGDFEMMNIIYRNEPAGDSLFGKCLHAYWLSHPEAKAVRNRSRYLFGLLSNVIRRSAGAPMKIGSIACGPAREVQMILESADSQGLNLANCEFHLLDQDIKALKHSHERLWEIAKVTSSPAKLNFVNKAIKNVITRGLPDADFDVIYSAGLFDYFSDPVAQLGAKALFKHVKPGGQLVIGNFNMTTPNQFTMRLALDWSLIYRSEEDLNRLFGNLGGDLRIEREAEGVNLFCLIRKPEAA
jgi:extracellular factor (EF) 3-hydroxypalmitic acid methyl ester biosynthesis protein